MIPVLVPWRTDNGQREHIWQLLQTRYWSNLPYRIVEGTPDDGPFNRSQALNRASDQAGAWEYAIIADADSFVHPGQLTGALRIANTTGQVVITHSRWVDVWPEEVGNALNEGCVQWREGRQVFEYTVSSMLVVPRIAWDAVNGFDERFEGWAYEDNAFMRAIKTLHGEPARLDGTVWHLSHDRPYEDANRSLSPLFKANKMRFSREYLGARDDPPRMREVVAGNRP